MKYKGTPIHNLKCETHYFQAHEKGVKNFELRFNDRNYKEGDIIRLYEVVNGEFTGRELPAREVTYVLYGGIFGLQVNWCILQLGDLVEFPQMGGTK